MTAQTIKRVVIVGGGTAGWMAATALSKIMGGVLDITLIESDQIGTVGVGEATIPTLVNYNRLIGIDEQAFMAATKATFKLGIEFVNWKQKGESYIHSFGITGKDHWTAGFWHFWLRGLKEGIDYKFGDYCLELIAAEQSKFAHLPKLGLNYAYHLDATAYAGFLRKMAEEHGAKRVEGKITSVQQNGESGYVESVTLEGGKVIEGDLFVDCSGFRALLIEGALHTGYHDWTHWLPCDSAIAVQTEAVSDPIPYTKSIAHDSGWQWRIPLQHRVGNGLVFCSNYQSDQSAIDTLMSNIEGKPLVDPRVIKFRTGTRRKHWNKNVVAVGLSSGFIEPLESTSIHLIQRSIFRLMQMFPHTGIVQADIDEFNAQTSYEMEHIRDFIILHYHVTERRDTPFWRQCANMDIPDGLKHRIALFRDAGRVFRPNDQLFAENSWVQVMLGQGIMPGQYHPIADRMTDEELHNFLAHIRSNVEKTAMQLPSHNDYVQQYCKATEVMAKGAA
ncbi:tryptophan halogenase family protein [Kordiimonas lacus]|uniref:Tryptophan halogenase n=1 Tax=Kordiimonas lacus TaxID=637679 RepID=A0A1G7D874_9PROT|nr:tryptophan halogenase family protein [Kordiimonas lacus]SDE47733.1 tryptophan halogenase [Kordiimonas lacus]